MEKQKSQLKQEKPSINPNTKNIIQTSIKNKKQLDRSATSYQYGTQEKQEGSKAQKVAQVLSYRRSIASTNQQDTQNRKAQISQKKALSAEHIEQKGPKKGILKKINKYYPLQELPNNQKLSKRSPIKKDESSESLSNSPPRTKTMNVRVSPQKHDKVICEAIDMKETQFFLKPKPLIKLSHLQGYTPSQYNANVKWLDQGYLCYPCGSTLVIQNIDLTEQKYCFTGLPISAVAVDQKEHLLILACENRSFYNYENVHYQHVWHDEMGKENNTPQISIDKNQSAEIMVWNYHTVQRVKHYQLPGFYAILALDYIQQTNNQSILICALDHLQRQTLILIQKDQILLKHISQFHIQKASFLKTNDPLNFISVGKQNIRFWHAKLDSLTIQGHSPYLGNYTRETSFTDFALCGDRLLTCCTLGRIFGISLQTKEITGVWQLGDGRIYSIAVDLTKNTVVTSHNGGVIKCWRNDFSEVTLQIKCESDSISFSSDGHGKLLCAQQDRSIGMLLIKEKKYTYLIHSHRKGIIDYSLHIPLRKLITASDDQTIRAWSLNGSVLQQEFELRYVDSLVTVVKTFNQRSQVFIGFENGLVRILDLKNYTITKDLKMDVGYIHCISTSSVDNIILVSGAKETVCLNSSLQIVKQYVHRHHGQGESRAFSGFNFDDSLHYIAFLEGTFAGSVQIYSSETLSEQFSLSFKQIITAINFNSKWNDLLIGLLNEKVRGGSVLKRYRIVKGQAHFVQEVYLTQKIDFIAIPFNTSYVFTVSNSQLIVWDYAFRGDDHGNPESQIYEVKHQIKKLLLDDAANQIISISDDSGFIIVWQSQASLTELIEGQQIPEIQDIQKDKQWETEIIPEQYVKINSLKPAHYSPSKQQIKKTQTQSPKKTIKSSPKEPTIIQKSPSNSLRQKQIQDIYDPYRLVHTGFSSNLLEPNKVEPQQTQIQHQPSSAIDHEQFNKLTIQNIIGNSLCNSEQTYIPQFPWSNQFKFYAVPVDHYVSITYFRENGQKQLLLEQKDVVSHVGICDKILYVLLKNNTIRLYDLASMSFIKIIELKCQFVLQLVVSLCSNYFLLLVGQPGDVTPHIQLLEVSSGRLITSSLLQGGSIQQNIFLQFVGDMQDLQFIILTNRLSQLWRVSQKGIFELMDIECQIQPGSTYRSACTFEQEQKLYLAIGQGQDLLIYDFRQTRLMIEIKNVTQQAITMLLASKTHLLMMTASPNIYYYSLSTPLQKIIEASQPLVISIDSQPISFSQLRGSEILLNGKSGQFWFCDLNQRVTLKLQSTIGQQCQVSQSYWMQNSSIVVAGISDGSVRLWNSENQEILTEYFAPKRLCQCLAIFDAKNIIASGYDDHHVRFFNMNDNTVIGSCNLGSAVTVLKVVQKQLVVLCGTQNGDVFLCILQQHKLAFEVQLKKITENNGFELSSFDCHFVDYLNIWALTTVNGRAAVFERNKLIEGDLVIQRLEKPKESFCDIERISYYLVDQFKLQQRPLDNTKVTIKFSIKDHDIVLIGQGNSIIFRNFREHINPKEVALTVTLQQFTLTDNSILVCSQDSFICVYDYETSIELIKQRMTIGNLRQNGQITQNTYSVGNLIFLFQLQ